MAKVLRCGDLMPGCNAVIEGKDEAEVMAKGAEHAKTAPDPKVVARWEAVKDPIGETLDALTDQHGGTADGWVQKFDEARGDVRAFFPR